MVLESTLFQNPSDLTADQPEPSVQVRRKIKSDTQSDIGKHLGFYADII